ncbi:serine/threonine-protein kinase [Streptomyces beijiangensis]|uniref:Serine/threonine protein kinase n=1 Tax=Streptomyces beijiangensis TaxID=163361 RepID=A0A939JFY3_9ACTN|nr:serine/threonine-protein kinase [Streptomyces beijiangensis]MBO0512868.1 serine/threonine protein kinase [Streptomyces beijiangensis]
MQPLEADEPRSIGAYRLLGRLGAGGMGRVYLGRSAGGRTVAVKVVHPHYALDEEFRARFRREVEAARRVGGAWTAPVLDADPEAPVPWVATGYVAGPALSQAVSAYGPLPEHSVRTLGAGLAEALAAVHHLGLVHRDVKPSNVLLTVDGPRLIDFGIARATDGTASLTSTGVSIGSPGYMSPEQILGKGVTGAADVFSLGAVLAYAVTGEPPFPGDSTASLLYKVVHEEPELGSVPDGLRALVASCLAKTPAGRPSPREIAERLAPAGASVLVAGGWLPGPLVEEVSRTAVRLLDLDSGVESLQDSGPIPFTSSAVVGSFGPPGPSFAAAHAVAPTEPPSTGSGTGSGTGRLSLSVTTESQPEGRRGRRVSCTLALAVAGALAAVTIGGSFLYNELRDQGTSHGDSAAGRPSSSASASGPASGSATEPTPSGTPAPTSSGAPASGSVPAAYSGNWQGQVAVTVLGKPLPAGTLTVVLKQGGAGDEIGTASQVDALGTSVCVDVLVLKKVSGGELIADGTARNKPGDADKCTSGSHLVKLRLTGDRLSYTSANPEGGNPYATLTRQDG